MQHFKGTPIGKTDDEVLSNLGFNDDYQCVLKIDHLSETLMSNRGKKLSNKLENCRVTREYIRRTSQKALLANYSLEIFARHSDNNP